jgi:hypothetical protein
MGKAAAAALSAVMGDIAQEAAKARELWSLADKVRAEKGP